MGPSPSKNCLQCAIIRDIAKYANSLKYLGLHLDEMLRWNEHAKRIRNKMIVVIDKFSQIRNCMDLSTAKLYYISLIRPQLEYAQQFYLACLQQI